MRKPFAVFVMSLLLGSVPAFADEMQGMHDHAAMAQGEEVHIHPGMTPVDVSLDPFSVPPPPVCGKESHTVPVHLEARELDGWLQDGIAYHYWTYNGKVPAPMLRVCQNDMVEVHFKNAEGNHATHSLDFHAATGTGGGAALTQAKSGEEKVFYFKASNPGLFVYHCATPVHAQHLANGMYGMILVEPPQALPKVDREFYVMQGEIYAKPPKDGRAALDTQALADELPRYYAFNGKTGTMTDNLTMNVKVGETVRFYFGVGGPNKMSSLHIIGAVFERAWENAALLNPPQLAVQTVPVVPGGAGVFDVRFDVAGKFLMVDHALSRLDKGAIATIVVEGKDRPDLFGAGTAPAP